MLSSCIDAVSTTWSNKDAAVLHGGIPGVIRPCVLTEVDPAADLMIGATLGCMSLAAHTKGFRTDVVKMLLGAAESFRSSYDTEYPDIWDALSAIPMVDNSTRMITMRANTREYSKIFHDAELQLLREEEPRILQSTNMLFSSGEDFDHRLDLVRGVLKQYAHGWSGFASEGKLLFCMIQGGHGMKMKGITGCVALAIAMDKAVVVIELMQGDIYNHGMQAVLGQPISEWFATGLGGVPAPAFHLLERAFDSSGRPHAGIPNLNSPHLRCDDVLALKDVPTIIVWILPALHAFFGPYGYPAIGESPLPVSFVMLKQACSATFPGVLRL